MRQLSTVRAIHRAGGEVRYVSNTEFHELSLNVHDTGDTIPTGFDSEWDESRYSFLTSWIYSPVVRDAWDHPVYVTLPEEAVEPAAFHAIGRLPGVRFLELHESGADPELLADSVTRLPELEWLLLWRSRADDQTLKAAGRLHKLIWLDLSSTAISDVGASAFGDLRQLRVLVLSNTAITDAGLLHLRECKSLERLELRDTQVSDRGIETLVSLENLHRLDLSGTQVTAASLPRLAELPHLERLDVSGTKIKEADVDEFRKQRPKVYVTCEWFPF